MSKCDLCGEAINLDDPENFYEITVWVHGPKRDGATARSNTGRVAHAECVRLIQQGQAPDQDRLF